MFKFEPNEFYNHDGRRVLDGAGRQGIDGVTGFGSTTKVHCGLILESFAHSKYLADFQFNDVLNWCVQIRDGKVSQKAR